MAAAQPTRQSDGPDIPDIPPLDVDEYVQWVGRVGYAMRSVPDPGNDAEFNAWVARTKTSVLETGETSSNRSSAVRSALPGWSWDALWQKICAIPTLVTSVGRLIGSLSIGGKLVASLDELRAGISKLLRAAAYALAADAKAFWSAATDKVLLLAQLRNTKPYKQGTDAVSVLEAEFGRFEVPLRAAIQTEFQVALRATTAAETSLKPLIDHLRLLGTVVERQGAAYAERCAIAINSISVLLAQVSPGAQAASDVLQALSKVLFSGSHDPKADNALLGKALEDLSVLLLVNYNPVLRVLRGVLLTANDPSGGIANRFVPLPVGPGTLADWLSGAPPYGTLKGQAADELEFRRELVAALDQYMRSESPTYGSLVRESDAREPVNVLSDLAQLLASVVFGFVFRSDGLPSPSVPKLDFADAFASQARADDMGGDLAANVARQLSYPIKSTLGVVLNGVWAVSPNNPPLVHGVSAALASLMQGAVEYSIRDILSACEIHETYLGPYAGHALYQWRSGVVYGDGSPLNVAVYARQGGVGADLATLLRLVLNAGTDPLKPLLLNLLRDYVAYREAVREYRPVSYSGPVDDVRGTATLSGASISVTATSTWQAASYPSTPVLRAYYNGVPYVMTPGTPVAAGTPQPYSETLPAAAGGNAVWLTSNYGGSCFVTVGGDA